MADDAWSPSLDPGAVFEGMPAATLLQAWDSAPALIAVTLGRQHRLVYQNRASKAMFGSCEIGTPLREAFPEVGEAGVAPLTRVLETGALVDVPPGGSACEISPVATWSCATSWLRWAGPADLSRELSSPRSTSPRRRAPRRPWRARGCWPN